MIYMGSKNRIAKHLLPALLAARGGRTWVEPFVGGANMIDKVENPRVGNDSHKYLIALLTALRDGWVPPSIFVSKKVYDDIKLDYGTRDDCLIGYVGFSYSFRGKFWAGYVTNGGDYKHNTKDKNYGAASRRNLLRQAPNLKGIDFRCGHYLDLTIPPNSLIYCDPPYEGTTGYEGHFDHYEFWQWCRDKSNEGHKVFISEYSAPDDFRCVKTINHYAYMAAGSDQSRIEKLFIPPGAGKL